MIEIEFDEDEVIEGFVMGLSNPNYKQDYEIAEQLYAQMMGWA